MLTAVEWLGTALQACGALWLALNIVSSRFAFFPMMVGSLIWGGIALGAENMPLMVLQAVFVAINMIGIARWFDPKAEDGAQ